MTWKTRIHDVSSSSLMYYYCRLISDWTWMYHWLTARDSSSLSLTHTHLLKHQQSVIAKASALIYSPKSNNKTPLSLTHTYTDNNNNNLRDNKDEVKIAEAADTDRESSCLAHSSLLWCFNYSLSPRMRFIHMNICIKKKKKLSKTFNSISEEIK